MTGWHELREAGARREAESGSDPVTSMLPNNEIKQFSSSAWGVACGSGVPFGK